MPDGYLPRPETLRTTQALIDAGLAPEIEREALDAIATRYAVAIPPAMQALIQEAGDPIARQFVPEPAELVMSQHESSDPIGDEAYSPLPGLVHRYADRVLLKPLLICPVYCRFCFRREHVGPAGGLLSQAALEDAFAYIQARPAIREVILTGGDPLMLSPRRLRAILDALQSIPHIELLRVHTRVPVADPSLVTGDLVAAMACEVPFWVVLHANHAAEFTPGARYAIGRIQAGGHPILGQSVLLRGVNDTAGALEALFRAMLRARIKPYYLHHLDPAPGTQRFHVPIAEGRALLEGLRGRVSGLAWPTYVLDIPGGHGKVPIGPAYLDGNTIRDPGGTAHALAAPTPSR